MRVIKKVDLEEHLVLFNAVNTPLNPHGCTKADEKRIDELFNDIIKDVAVTKEGMYRFDKLTLPRNLKLTDAAWDELKKNYLSRLAYPTYHAMKNRLPKLQERILNAQYIKDKEKK